MGGTGKGDKLDSSGNAAHTGGSGQAGSPTQECEKATIEVVVKRPAPAADEPAFQCEIRLVDTGTKAEQSRSEACEQVAKFEGLEAGTYEVGAKVPSGKGYSFKKPATATAVAGKTEKVVLELVKLEIEKVTPEADAKQFVNLDRAVVDPADPHLGRVFAATAKITEATAGVPIYFFLEPGDKNLEHLGAPHAAEVAASATTDDKGIANVDVKLSTYGGDRFRLVASLCEDPKHPCAATKRSAWLTVWRRIWFHAAIAEGFDTEAPTRSIEAWKNVFVDFVDAGTKRYRPADLEADLRPRTFYPRWMLKGGADDTSAAAVTDLNRAKIQALLADDPKKPLKAPMVVCEELLRDHGQTEEIEVTVDSLAEDTATREKYVELVASDGVIVKPPIQTGDLVVTGEWAIETSSWRSARRALSSLWASVSRSTVAAPGAVSGVITDADIKIAKGRANTRTFRFVWPSGARVPTADEPARLKISVRRARSILGLSSGGKIVAVFDPGDVNDFSDTVTHEIGHSVGQVAKTQVAPLPPNHWYEDIHGGRGDHCHSVNVEDPGTLVDLTTPRKTLDGTGRDVTRIYGTGSCVMFASYDASCTGKFCPKCAPYVRIQDMSQWRGSA